MSNTFLDNIINSSKPKLLEEQKSLLDQFSTLTLFMDTQSRITLANNAVLKHMGYKRLDDVLGKTAEATKSSASELAEEFIEQNKNIIHEGKKLSILTCAPSASGQFCFYLSPRKPIKDQYGNIIGIAYQGIDLVNTSMLNSAVSLFRNKKGVLTQGLLTLKTAYDDSYALSPQDLDCLAFLLRGFSSKEIANRLKLNVRTVEYHIANMRAKFNVKSKKLLVDKAMALGYFNFIPEHWWLP